MEKLGFFQSNLFTSFQKNVYIILWKEVESDRLAELSLRQRLPIFMIYNFPASKSNYSWQKKGGRKANAFTYLKKKLY